MASISNLPEIRIGAVLKWKRSESDAWSIGRVVDVDDVNIHTHGIATVGNDPFKLPHAKYQQLRKQRLAEHASKADIRAHLVRTRTAYLHSYQRIKEDLENRLENEKKLLEAFERRMKFAFRELC